MRVFKSLLSFLFWNIPKELSFESTILRLIVVQPLGRVWHFVSPWTAAHQTALSTISWSLLKLMSVESVMPSNHFILCYSLLLPSIFPSIRVFSNGRLIWDWQLKLLIENEGEGNWFLTWQVLSQMFFHFFTTVSWGKYHPHLLIRKLKLRTSLVVQWLRLHALNEGGPRFNPWSGN